MPMEETPVVGAVYEDANGQTFEVLAFDEDEGIVEIEYVDGTVDEIDLETWYGLDLEQVDSAEDQESPDLDYDEDYEEDVDLDEDGDDFDDEEEQ